MSTMPVLLAVVGALVAILWSGRRLADRLGRRLDRIEGRLAGLDSALRRVEESLADREIHGPSPSVAMRGDRPHRPSPSRPRPARPGASAPEQAPTLIAVPDLSGPGRAVGSQAEAAGRATASGDLAGRFGRIWAMADEGETAGRIASATGHPVGQVELVLNLRRRLIDGRDDRHGEEAG